MEIQIIYNTWYHFDDIININHLDLDVDVKDGAYNLLIKIY